MSFALQDMSIRARGSVSVPLRRSEKMKGQGHRAPGTGHEAIYFEPPMNGLIPVPFVISDKKSAPDKPGADFQERELGRISLRDWVRWRGIWP